MSPAGKNFCSKIFNFKSHVFVVLLCASLASPSCAGTNPQQTSPTQPQQQRSNLPPPSSAPAFTLGMNFLWGNGEPKGLEDRLSRMENMGIKQARTDWEWRAVESKKGTYDWSAIDRMMQLAHKHRIEILPMVHYAPEWALPNVKKPSGVYQLAPRDDAFGDYTRFLAASIDRYGPGGNAPFAFTPIQYWQVWNEPNIKEFWGPKPDSGRFVNFMKTVNKGLGERRNKVKIVHAGLSKSDTDFMWSLWDKEPGYCHLFDVMAIHSYFFNPKGGVRGVEDIDKDIPEYAKLGFIGGKDHGYLPKVFNVRRFMGYKEGCEHTPIWITEIGFLSTKKDQGMFSGTTPYAIKEDQSAQLAQKTLRYINEKLTTKPFGPGSRNMATNVTRVYWFTLDDYGFPNETGNFGLYRPDGTQREGLKNSVLQYTR